MTDRAHSIIALLLKLVLWTLFFLTPIHDSLAAVAVLVCIDLFTGIWAAIKKKQLITSNSLFRTIPKLILYEVAVFSTFIVERTFIKHDIAGLPVVPLVKIVAGFIAATELKSNLENISAITGLDLWPQIRDLINPKKPRD